MVEESERSVGSLFKQFEHHRQTIQEARAETVRVTPEQVQNSKALCYIKDADCNMVAISEGCKQAYGYSGADWVGLEHGEVWGLAAAHRFDKHDRGVLITGGGFMGYETWCISGEEVTELVIKIPQFEDGKIVGTFGIILKDIF